MSSYVAIANLAAIAVGTSARLTAPGDNTVLGRAVAAVWDISRRAALQDGSWNFAMAREKLPALKDAPKHGFERQFQLPTDCLKLVEVYGGERLHYQREGDRILADAAGSLEIRYLRDVTEPAEFDPGFAEAFALKIALVIGRRIAGSAFDKDRTYRAYRDALSAAQGSDALENPPIGQEESDWVLARLNGGHAGTLGGWIDGGA